MPHATTNGISMHYTRRGHGEPLLLIMGFGTSAALWSEEFLDALAPHFDLIVPDNRGTGQSEKPSVGYGIDVMADDLAGLLDALRITSADVFGVSMGGMIAQEFALRHPSRVRRLVLGCTHPGGAQAVTADPAVLALIGARPGMSPREAIEGIYAAMSTDETRRTRSEFLARITARMLAHRTPGFVLKAQMEGIAALDTWERLPQLAAPTLVITGDADRLVPPENSRRIAGRIPGARLAVIPGAAHNFFWEAQDETVRLLTEALAPGGERSG